MDLLIASDVENETALVDGVVLMPPLDCFLVLLFLDLFEEEYLVRAPGNDDFVVNYVDLRQILTIKLLELVVLDLVDINGESLTLSIEAVDLVGELIKEDFLREVQLRALELDANRSLDYDFILVGVDEMVVTKLLLVKQVDEH